MEIISYMRGVRNTEGFKTKDSIFVLLWDYKTGIEIIWLNLLLFGKNSVKQ